MTEAMSCSPVAMRATALRRISSFTGTERHPEARSSPRVAGRVVSGMRAKLPRGRRGPGGRSGGGRSGGPGGELDGGRAVEGRLQAVGDVAIGPHQRVAGDAGVARVAV